MQWVFKRVQAGIVGEIASLESIATQFRFDIQETKSEDAWERLRAEYEPDFVEFMDTQVIGPG